MSFTLSARDVRKRYGAVQALADGALEIRSGEVVALLGSNGSGKSTLGKILTGITQPDAGTLTLEGETVQFRSPIEARRRGITAVYQELSLVPDLTVAENVFLGHEPTHLGGVDRMAMRARTRELLERFGDTFATTVDPDTFVTDLAPSERQLIEILKALSRKPKALILDEATASLDAQQVNRLFSLIEQWKDEGMAIAFISHRMDEIFRIADRAVVLRNGETVGDRPIDQTDEDELVVLMTGEALDYRRAKMSVPEGADAVLEARGLRADGLEGLDLQLHAGELLGIGGLQGQGQERLLLALFGAIPHAGTVVLRGESVRLRNPRTAMEHGITYVPGDRGSEGLLRIRSILENLHLPSWPRYGVPLDMRRARVDADGVADDLDIKLASLDEPVSNLSGGNAQKVVIGKWLLRNPDVLLLNDPTKGVDVGAKAEFYTLLEDLQRRGAAILFYSSDDDELLSLCHRVMVMQDGRVTATLAGERLTHANLVAAAMGSQVERSSAGEGARA